jgi:hypothetical protein
MAKDHFWSLSLIVLAWFSHLIFDFGYTITNNIPVIICKLLLLAVYAVYQIPAFTISALFGYIFWK